MKNQYKDVILCVECGYKYRFFGEDAEVKPFFNHQHCFIVVKITHDPCRSTCMWYNVNPSKYGNGTMCVCPAERFWGKIQKKKRFWGWYHVLINCWFQMSSWYSLKSISVIQEEYRCFHIKLYAKKYCKIYLWHAVDIDRDIFKKTAMWFEFLSFLAEKNHSNRSIFLQLYFGANSSGLLLFFSWVAAYLMCTMCSHKEICKNE